MGFLTDKEWLQKADYAGGVYAAFEAGLSHAQLDPNESEIRYSVKVAHHFWLNAKPAVDELTKHMETLYDEN